MIEKWLLDALVQVKRVGNLLDEVLDISKQMAEAIDRNDQVSVQMLIAMRQEPIEKLKVADQVLRDQVSGQADPEQGQRLSALLNGAEAGTGEEQALAAQVAANARRLKRVLELDEAVNRKLARDKSVYQKN